MTLTTKWMRGSSPVFWGGVRFSKLEYDQVPRVRTQTSGGSLASEGAGAFAACGRSQFPEDGFLSEVTNGPIITNIDDSGNVIADGTGSSFVSFDPLCLATFLLGRDPVVPSADQVQTLQNVNIEEETTAAYLQANYRGVWGDYPVRGNFGLRIVDTEVSSQGFRGDLMVVREPDGTISGLQVDGGNLVSITDTHSYTEYLPSANLVVDLQEDLLFRGAIFRALSRPDPSDLGLGRGFGTDVDNDAGSADVSDIVAQVNGFGNPRLDPLLSWNYDAALEWYPNEDTILAVGVYYKDFNGGFENVAQLETFTVEGEDLQAIVTTNQTSDDESTIFGVEVTATHSFSYLPNAWSGLGFKFSYNYADSDFEFEDANFGEATLINADGSQTQRVGIVPPANVPGLSEHVLSAQLYYNIGNWDFQGVYKYRSEYFQQFINTPGNLRYIGDTDVVEARVSYQVNDNVRLSLEGINLLDEPRRQFNPTPDSFSEVNVFGPRLFFGIRGKF